MGDPAVEFSKDQLGLREIQYSEAPVSRVMPKNSVSENDNGINFVHPASELRRVMRDVLQPRDEQAFCFLDEGRLRTRVALYRENFLPDLAERRISYAMKANPKRRILEILVEEGLDGFDCASITEVREALSFVNSRGVYFNHPIKKTSAIREARDYGVTYFTAQSSQGIQRIMDSDPSAVSSSQLEIALRVAMTNENAAIDLSSKYGCLPDEVKHLVQEIRDSGAKASFAMNTGSQNSEVQSYCDGIELLAKLAEKNGKVNSVNLGGGLPINYFNHDHHDLKEYLRRISESVRANVHRILRYTEDEGRIIIEPGRSMIADSVDLVIPVLEIDERSGEKRAYIDDGVFTSFSDRVVHKWPYKYDVYMSDGRPASPSQRTHTLYGRTCDSGDVLGKVELPDNLRVGDYLWLKNAGAYMDSQTTQFNGFEPPQYVSYNSNS